MVTTRRSSFGVQDGDTLALRSKSASTVTETTPTKKRKEYAVGVRSSSRKKRKAFGNDGADIAAAEVEETQLTFLEHAKLSDEPPSSPVKDQDTGIAISQLEGKRDEAAESISWLGDNLVPLPAEDPTPGASARKDREVADPVGQAVLPDDQSSKDLDPDAEELTKRNDAEEKPLTNKEISNEAQKLDDAAGQQPPTQLTAPNVHKRFGSEEPELTEEGNAADEPLDSDQEPGAVNVTGDIAISSDDEAPEVVGSKSIATDSRPHLKALRRAKRRVKPNKAGSEQADTVMTERVPAEKDQLFVDLLPEALPKSKTEAHFTASEPPSIPARSTGSSLQLSKKRKLLEEREKKPKDVVKDGVTYRTVSRKEPVVFLSKSRTASHLPPKSNANNSRLRKQVLGRKRVQHIWGGRSTFLRS